MQRTKLGIALILAATAAAPAGCGGSSAGPLDGVDAIVFLQRPKRNEMGDIFQYTSYLPTSHIMKLSPPTADGVLTPICCDQAGADFAKMDISSYDLSFDATQIVLSAKLTESQHYGLFILNLADGKVAQLATNPNRDYVYPVFAPGNKILFMTNAVVEQGAPQHRDEYERGTTIQIGRMNSDGTGEEEGPRNLSHRAFPSMMSDGRVMFTEWRHLGDTNEGDLAILNPDMTLDREGYGREGTAPANSYLKAREMAPGRMIAIATSRDRTVQAGALIDIRLGKVSSDGGIVRADTEMSERNASYKILTPDVPLTNDPSPSTVGRYYDAYPLNGRETPDLLVSWADGPVESGTLSAAGMSADFGIYLYDSAANARHPIYNDPAMWDVAPRPLAPRNAPPEIQSTTTAQGTGGVLIGSMDVTISTLFKLDKAKIYGVRVMEGFSSEEGFPEMFGSSRQEGHAQLAVAPMFPDGSWAAVVPGNIPVHLQVIDPFGMAMATEPVWFSERPGTDPDHPRTRTCTGCHDPREKSEATNPGFSQAIAAGATPAMSTVARSNRASTTYSRDKIVGVPWNLSLQTIFDNNCVSCHNGVYDASQPNKNPKYTLTDPVTGKTADWVFNLKGDPVSLSVGNFMMDGYSASYLSLAGPDMEAIEKAKIVVTGDLKVYLKPLDALNSPLMQKLNPPQQYPTQNLDVRAFPTTTNPPHAIAVGHELTADEYLRLVMSADMGANYYSRENKTGAPAPN